MFSNDGEESNTANGVNIATEFNEFKNKIMRHKTKRIQGKNTNLKHMKSTKYHYCVLMIKDLY